MYRSQLLTRRDADQLADATELARLRRDELEPEHARIGDRVPHAAERDVDADRPEPLHLERRVDQRDERRHVRQLDALDAAVATRRSHFDDAGGRLEAQDGLWL